MSKTKRGFNLELKQNLSPEIKEVFDWYLENMKVVPNLARIMSEAPALLQSYFQTQLNLLNKGALSPEENNIVQMSIAVENRCTYCATGHLLAGKMIFGSTEEVMDNIIAESELTKEKFNALRKFALKVYQTKGHVSEADLAEFYLVGYNRAQALDVVTNISTKIMSNFTNHMADNELDEVLIPLTEKVPF